jgi:hypothetical protein
MKKSRFLTVTLAGILLIAPLACRNTTGDGESEGRGEEEEPGVRIAIDDTYDAVRRGVRLILTYDSTSSAFVGTVENVIDETVSAVRVEVHLSNGTELGPTERTTSHPARKQPSSYLLKVKTSNGGRPMQSLAKAKNTAASTKVNMEVSAEVNTEASAKVNIIDKSRIYI